MKFDYKKIASVVASAVMISSTIGFAAAANYPTPYTDAGAAVVYGTNAANTDMAAAINIYDQLKAQTSSGSTTTTGGSTTVSGEAKAVQTASQKLYLGDVMNNTKRLFTSDDLPTVLASGTLSGSDGKDYKFDQKLEVPNAIVKYGETTDNLASPVIFADFDASSYYYTLKVIFPTAVDPGNLSSDAISLFGKNYVFSGSAGDLSTTSITLFEKSTPVIVNDGESVTAEGHTISVAVEDATNVAITVDGTTATKAEGWSGKIGGVDVYVKNVVGPNVAGTSRYAELYLNSNKLILSNGDDVTLGSDTIDGATATIVTSGTSKISEIDIKVSPYQLSDSIKYIKLGDKLIDPVFGTLKFELSSVTPALDDASRDYVLIRPSGEKKASLEFTNKAGKKYSLDVLKPSTERLNTTYGDTGFNATGVDTLGTYTYNATALGVGTDYNLISTAAGNASENDYFITCSSEYTQIWQVKTIKPSDTKIKLVDIGSDSSSLDLSIGAATGSTASLTLADGNAATVTLSSNVSGAETISVSSACAYLYTKGGARIDLGTANAPTSNLSSIRITQETPYNGGDFKSNTGSSLGAKNITVRFAYQSGRSGKDMFIRDVLSGTTDGTSGTDFYAQDVGDTDNYYVTNYGTFVKQTGDTDKQVEVYYPTDAMEVGFYIGENAAQITPGSTGTGSGVITIAKDTDDITTFKDKNLIIVGGSCINAAAAKFLGSDIPLCGADFSAKTNVGAGGYIIQVLQSPYNTAKTAMLVAGYNAEDTQTAVKRAMTIGGVKTDVGTTEVYPVTS